MILDEVLGNLDYAARQSGLLEAGPAVTAHIEVEFRQVSCFGRLFQLDPQHQFPDAFHVAARDQLQTKQVIALHTLYLPPRQAAGTKAGHDTPFVLSFLQKVPVPSSVFATAQTMTTSGRKTWHSASLQASPNGPVYATGKALFIMPRQQQATADPHTSAAAQSGGPPEQPAGMQAPTVEPQPPAGQLSPQTAQVPLAGKFLVGCVCTMCLKGSAGAGQQSCPL